MPPFQHLCRRLSLDLSLSRSLSHSLARAHAHTLSLRNTHTVSLSIAHALSLSLSVCLSFCFRHSLSHTGKCSYHNTMLYGKGKVGNTKSSQSIWQTEKRKKVHEARHKTKEGISSTSPKVIRDTFAKPPALAMSTQKGSVFQ